MRQASPVKRVMFNGCTWGGVSWCLSKTSGSSTSCLCNRLRLIEEDRSVGVAWYRSVGIDRRSDCSSVTASFEKSDPAESPGKRFGESGGKRFMKDVEIAPLDQVTKVTTSMTVFPEHL